MYSQDVYYGSMGPPHGLATNPYGFGYPMPMYNPYTEPPMGYDPAATMYDIGSGFPMPHPSATLANAAPASNIPTPPTSVISPNTENPNTENPYTENSNIATPEAE